MSQSSIKRQTASEYKIRVCKVMNHISQNLDRNLSLEELAEVAAFSRFHFHRIFKAVVGETTADFTRRLRVEMAANRLLSNQSEEITTIAMECGFSSSQNFSKAFRLHFDMTPTQFRKSKIGNKHSNKENALTLGMLNNPDTDYYELLNIERGNEVKAEVKDMPEYHVAYVRKMGAYGKDIAVEAFGELVQWTGPLGYMKSGAHMAIYWDNPEITSPEKCRMDACVSVPPGTISDDKVDFQTIEGGSYAVCRFELVPENFQPAWDDSCKWVVDNGYVFHDNKPCYELYHNNPEEHPEGKLVFDICIPLK